jgi:uncharacterized membrane protein YdjX (TVP38/TMEM64 family)
MKDPLKVAAVLAIAFALTLPLLRGTGLITEDGVRAFLESAHQIHPGWLALIVILLLLFDLFVAIPTMTTILIAGYFMGPLFGGLASAVGLMLLGTTGYGLGRRLGRPILLRLFKDERRLADIETAFQRNDLLVLFACQALPILPEVSACLAGVSRMPFARFCLGFGVGVVPFAFIVAWAGSVSTLNNPAPAIYTAIGVSVTLLLVWTALQRR